MKPGDVYRCSSPPPYGAPELMHGTDAHQLSVIYGQAVALPCMVMINLGSAAARCSRHSTHHGSAGSQPRAWAAPCTAVMGGMTTTAD